MNVRFPAAWPEHTVGSHKAAASPTLITEAVPEKQATARRTSVCTPTLGSAKSGLSQTMSAKQRVLVLPRQQN